jgi:hypothetical protein
MSSELITEAIVACNKQLASFPSVLWQRIDLKATGSIVGAHLAYDIALRAEAMVNPIEKGHPDIVPLSAANATEVELRNYPVGLEIKGTCGGTPKGTLLKAGDERFPLLNGITWQAHHQQVNRLLGIVWDFTDIASAGSPTVTAAFYSGDLTPGDWGSVAGTSGRNTKVCGMRASGKQKMAAGLVCVLNKDGYTSRYVRLLSGRLA